MQTKRNEMRKTKADVNNLLKKCKQESLQRRHQLEQDVRENNKKIKKIKRKNALLELKNMRKSKKLINLLDADIYYVKEQNGTKIVHSLGYHYETDHTEEPGYRRLEYRDLYLEPDKLRTDENYYDTMQSQVKQYIYDLTYEECMASIKDWINGATALPMVEVWDETPCGLYYDK